MYKKILGLMLLLVSGYAFAATTPGIPYGGFARDTGTSKDQVLVYIKPVNQGDPSEAFGLILRYSSGDHYGIFATLYKVEQWEPNLLMWVPISQSQNHYLTTPRDYQPLYVSHMRTQDNTLYLDFSAYKQSGCTQGLNQFAVKSEPQMKWLNVPQTTAALESLAENKDEISVSGTSLNGQLALSQLKSGPFYVDRNANNSAFSAVRIAKLDPLSASGWSLNRPVLAVMASVTDENGHAILNFIKMKHSNDDPGRVCNWTDDAYAQNSDDVSSDLFPWVEGSSCGWFGCGSSSSSSPYDNNNYGDNRP